MAKAAILGVARLGGVRLSFFPQRDVDHLALTPHCGLCVGDCKLRVRCMLCATFVHR
jgi:hypothetical protein